MFTNYKKYMEQWPHADVFLINPRSIWNLWRTIRIFTQRRILKNPPSSGFIGRNELHFEELYCLNVIHFGLFNLFNDLDLVIVYFFIFCSCRFRFIVTNLWSY